MMALLLVSVVSRTLPTRRGQKLWATTVRQAQLFCVEEEATPGIVNVEYVEYSGEV